jgi:hypothetical protein
MTNRLALTSFVRCFQALQNKDPRLIILGARQIADAEDLPPEMRERALAQFDPSSFDPLHSCQAVLGHPGLRVFYDIGRAMNCPSPWVAGISTFYPQLNAMNGQFGSEVDRGYIHAHRIRRPISAISARELIRANLGACWMTDIEGADFEVGRQILLHGKSCLLLIEHALLSQEEKITMRALGTALGYELYQDEEDMCFAQGCSAP